MDASEYQKLSARTLVDKPGFELSNRQLMILWDAIGISGEAGEIAELVKKGIFHRHIVNSIEFRKEIGDILWYVAALCTTLSLDLSEIMQENIEKLKIRYPNGFSVEDSKRRVDKEPDRFWKCPDCDFSISSDIRPNLCPECGGPNLELYPFSKSLNSNV